MDESKWEIERKTKPLKRCFEKRVLFFFNSRDLLNQSHYIGAMVVNTEALMATFMKIVKTIRPLNISSNNE